MNDSNEVSKPSYDPLKPAYDVLVVDDTPDWQRRLAQLITVVVGHVRANEILDDAVLGAALAEVDAALPDDDLGIDEPPALGAEAACRAQERVVAKLHPAFLPGS